MTGTSEAEIADLLERGGLGDPSAAEKLLTFLYSELHVIAKGCMANQPPEHTLQATALVNEAFIRLLSSKEGRWRSRAHFLAVAARAMRCVLVDHARGRAAKKPRGAGKRMALDQIVVSYEERALDLLALDSALKRLSEVDEPMARAVELRFFTGMELTEIARFLGMSQRTFERQWSATRTWLWKEVS